MVIPVVISYLQIDHKHIHTVTHSLTQQETTRVSSPPPSTFSFPLSSFAPAMWQRISTNAPQSGSSTLGTETAVAPEETPALLLKLSRIQTEYQSLLNQLPNDCSQMHTLGAAGLSIIAPIGMQHPVLVHCRDSWTEVQRRHDGSVDFNRSWEEYAVGFGSPGTEFWFGNEGLHLLSQDNCSELRIEMRDIYDRTWVAEYGYFKVEPRTSGYRLIISDYRGNASDALEYQNHMEFSAVDADRDISNTHCAANYEGGWWFSHCQHANLNGRYNLGLTWFDATRNEWIAVKSSRMLVGKDQVCLRAMALERLASTNANAKKAV